MNSKNILIISLKIGAIIIAINTLERLPSLYADYLSDSTKVTGGIIFYNAIPLTAGLFISILFWFFPNVLLKYLVLDGSYENNGNVDSSKLGGFIISAVGLYILAYSISDMVYHIVFIRESIIIFGSTFGATPENKAQIFATIAEITIGMALLFGGKFFSLLLFRLQKEMKDKGL